MSQVAVRVGCDDRPVVGSLRGRRDSRMVASCLRHTCCSQGCYVQGAVTARVSASASCAGRSARCTAASAATRSRGGGMSRGRM